MFHRRAATVSGGFGWRAAPVHVAVFSYLKGYKPEHEMSDAKPYIDGNTLWLPYDLAALNDVLDRLDTVPPPPPGYTLYPGQDPAVALADLAAGDTLWLADGTHPYALHLPKAVNVRAASGARPVVSGWRSMEWIMHENRIDSPPVYRAWYNRFDNRLTHRTSNNAGFPAARQAVHNLAARPDMVFAGGSPIESRYDEKNGWLYITLPDGVPIDSVRVAQYPQLLTAADGINNVTVEGITFDGAANTTKQGAVQAYGEGWVFDRVTVRNVNTVGFMVGGIGHRFVDCWADDCGQMGWAGKSDSGVFESCGMRRANWKGFDAGWEAGMKFSYSRRNTWINWTATDCNAPGFWLDISNDDNTLDGFEITGCMKAGALLEHYARGNTYRNGAIHGTRAWPVTGARVGLQVQSNIIGNTFENIAIQDSGTPVVYKATESRGPSSKNRFNVVAGDAPWRIEGRLTGDDTFTNCTPQPV